eukprot:GILK01013071.1.p1 GENE.GILK01013071.1~~GILK01013071.1.p1  ORF type:complete len:678 (+),score=109.94 GILK01013071.1:50-2083(+)
MRLWRCPFHHVAGFGFVFVLATLSLSILLFSELTDWTQARFQTVYYDVTEDFLMQRETNSMFLPMLAEEFLFNSSDPTMSSRITRKQFALFLDDNNVHPDCTFLNISVINTKSHKECENVWVQSQFSSFSSVAQRVNTIYGLWFPALSFPSSYLLVPPMPTADKVILNFTAMSLTASADRIAVCLDRLVSSFDRSIIRTFRDRDTCASCSITKSPLLFLLSEDTLSIEWETDRAVLLSSTKEFVKFVFVEVNPACSVASVIDTERQPFLGASAPPHASSSSSPLSSSSSSPSSLSPFSVKFRKFQTTQINGNRFLHRLILNMTSLLSTQSITCPSLGQVRLSYRIVCGSSSTPTFDIKLDAFTDNMLKLENDSNASTSMSKTVVAVVGDNQYGAATYRQLLQAIARKTTKTMGSPKKGAGWLFDIDTTLDTRTGPDLFLHLGDFVHNPCILKEWRTYFHAPFEVGRLGQTTPLLLTAGNHDGFNSFSLAYAFPPFHRPLWRAFTVNSARFVILYSEQQVPAQDDWLNQELKSIQFTSASFRIVVVHIPPYIEYWEPDAWNNKGENQWGRFIRESWMPKFKANHVDLILSGHEHAYQRGVSNSVTVIISGGGGGALETDKVHNWKVYSVTKLVHHFLWLTLSECQLDIEAYDTHSVFDAISIISKHKSNCASRPTSSG